MSNLDDCTVPGVMGIPSTIHANQCPVCQGAAVSLFESYRGYDVHQCADCGLQFSPPGAYEPHKYGLAYAGVSVTSDGFGNYGALSASLQEASAEMWESEWFVSEAQRVALNLIMSCKGRGARVLDIGCGTGWFLAAAKRRGLHPMGVDIADVPIAELRSRGFTVGVATIEHVPANWPTPDVVTLFEVLEHVPQPVEFLRSIREGYPKSKLLITVPSPKRWPLLLGARSEGDYPPHHLYRWTAQSLAVASLQAGYSTCSVRFPAPTAREAASVAIPPLMRAAFSRRAAVPSMQVNLVPHKRRPLIADIRLRRVKRVALWPAIVCMRVLGMSALSMMAELDPLAGEC